MITLAPNVGFDWLLARFDPKVGWLGEAKSLAAMDGWKILGVVAYDGFTPHECQMHLAIEDRRCVTRRVLRAVFAYPFTQLKLARVTACVALSNAAILELVQRLGFVYEGRKRCGFGDEDELIFGLLRSECRWH